MMSKIHNILKSQRCLHFCMKFFTSLNGFKFYMQVSDTDSNKLREL